MKTAFDFIVIGAQKAGTTSLFEYMRRHPAIFVPAGKEAPFYSHDAVWGAGWRRYAEKAFALAPTTRAWGSATPHYMLGSVYAPADVTALARDDRTERIVPARIRQHAPDTKLIAILRDPVERAFSHHRMEVLRGAETSPFEKAIGKLLDPDLLARSRRVPTETTSYVTTGEYGRILRPYFELFDAARIHVCFSMDLDAAPCAVIRSIWSFLGIEDFVPDNLGRRYRVGGGRRRAQWLDLDRFQDRVASSRPIRAAWRALPRSARARLDSSFNELNYRVDLRNRTAAAETRVPEPAAARLREHYAGDRRVLSELLEREIPWQ